MAAAIPSLDFADAALQHGTGNRAAFVAEGESGASAGFADASLRHDYVNGCETSPVAFVEGVYVDPPYRSHGVDRALLAMVEAWGRTMGCAELTSDALLSNDQSHAFHLALDFDETEPVVYFRKAL
jgi:aminoglycoside 6'-N-acetyltransferase I